MRKMSKMKKGLVGLTAAAMLAGSCISGPAFAEDNTINSTEVGKEVTFTVTIGEEWTVTVPADITVTWNGDEHKFSISADHLKATISDSPRFQNGKKLVVYLHDKTTEGQAINSLTFTEENPVGTANTYTMDLLKNNSPLTEGKILEVEPGASTGLEQGLSGEVTGVYRSGTYKATAAFVVKVE